MRKGPHAVRRNGGVAQRRQHPLERDEGGQIHLAVDAVLEAEEVPVWARRADLDDIAQRLSSGAIGPNGRCRAATRRSRITNVALSDS